MKEKLKYKLNLTGAGDMGMDETSIHIKKKINLCKV